MMKRRNIIIWLVMLFVFVAVFISYVWFEYDTCGMIVGTYMEVDSLPEYAKQTLVGNPKIICVFENKAGNPVYVRCNLEGRIVEVCCFNKRYTGNSDWAFMQITDGMDLKEVVQLLGRPVMIGGSGILQTHYLDSNDVKVRIVLKKEYSGSGWDTETKYKVNGKPHRMGEDAEKYGEIITLPLQKYITLTVGLLTAAIIVFCLKKKGILFKKKQVQEQGDSSI